MVQSAGNNRKVTVDRPAEVCRRCIDTAESFRMTPRCNECEAITGEFVGIAPTMLGTCGIVKHADGRMKRYPIDTIRFVDGGNE